MESLRINRKSVTGACRLTPIQNYNRLFILQARLSSKYIAIIIGAGLILYFPARIILYSIQLWFRVKEYYPAWTTGLFDLTIILIWFLTITVVAARYIGAPGRPTFRPSKSLSSPKGDGFTAGAYARDVSYTGSTEGWRVVAIPVSGRQEREPTKTFKRHLSPYGDDEREEIEKQSE